MLHTSRTGYSAYSRVSGSYYPSTRSKTNPVIAKTLHPIRITMLHSISAAATVEPVPELNGSNGAYPLIMLPLRQTKQVHFIRHGQGYHNVAGAIDHDNYMSEEWFDAHLTPEGWRQGEELNTHIVAAGLKPELVVVSPMMRALETSVAAFGRGEPQNGDIPLMAARAGDGKHSVAHSAVTAQGTPPFLVHELCREQLGEHPCDKRQFTSESRAQFPGMDWSLQTDEEDMLWTAESRESEADITSRGREFLLWLMMRPESSIAVVSHSSFLKHLSASFGQDLSKPVQEDLHRWYENCEMRTLVVANIVEPSPADRHHFKGGAPCG